MTVALWIIGAVAVITITYLAYLIGRVKGMQDVRDLSISADNLIACANSTLDLCERMSHTKVAENSQMIQSDEKSNTE